MNPYLYFPRDGRFSEYREELLAENVIAVDTETTGLDPNSDSLRLIQIAVFGKPVFVLDMLLCDNADRDAVAQVLMAPSIKIFQNAKFDIRFLQASGFETNGRIFDTMLAAQLLKTPEGPARFGLDSISSFFLGTTVSKEEQTSGFDGELREAQIEYAARDASVLLELRSVMAPALVSNGLTDIAAIEFQCTRAIADIESSGILIDIDRWNVLTNETREICRQAESRLFKHAGNRIVQPDFFGGETAVGLNLNSNKQVLDLLHDNGINVADTSKAALSPYRNEPLVRDLQEYRKAAKMLGGFLEPMPSFINPATGRIHANYSQIGASSGRMSCWGPNMQQIPRESSFRECFIPSTGNSTGNSLVIADYSQIELRVAAQIARDEMMIEAYRNGGDLHKLTASLITGTPVDSVTKKQRQAAKAVNFGLIFAMGARGLQAYAQDTYDVEMSLEEAEEFRDRFFRAYKGINDWHNSIKRNPPRVSRSLAGRRYFHREDEGLAGLYNTPVQGSAADIIKNALGMLTGTLKGTGARIIAVVHDEILLEAPSENALKVAGILKDTMEHADGGFMPDVPLAAETQVASSWAEKQ